MRNGSEQLRTRQEDGGKEQFRTSHVGRLPAPTGFEETALRLARGEDVAARVVAVVAEVVKRQIEIGRSPEGENSAR